MTETKRPNVLLIIIDQFRADLLDGDLAAFANLKALSGLAKESCSFRRHYSVVTPCGPSRVSLFTGQYAMNHRAVRNGTPLRHDTPNLAIEMRAAGYNPLLFGYTDVAQDPRVLDPGDARLESYEELLPGFTEAVRQRQESGDEDWRNHLRARGYDVPEGDNLYIPNGKTIDSPARYRAEDSDTAYLTDRFLERMKEEEPGWFATLTYIRPHPPFVAPAPFNTLYDPELVPPPQHSEDVDTHPFVKATRAARPPASTVEGFPDLANSPDVTKQLRALYLGLAAEVDQHIGRVISWLKSSGQLDETIIVLTADHGEMLGDFGLWGKQSFHDAAFHVPLILRVPGLQPRQIETMTESIDVAPTILDLVGHQTPDSMNGQSLLGLAESGSGEREFTMSEIDFGDPVQPTKTQESLGLHSSKSSLSVLRTNTQRLIHFSSNLPQIVFDLEAGGEGQDISGKEEGREICLDLSRKMLCHRMQHPESMFSKTMVKEGGVRWGSF